MDVISTIVLLSLGAVPLALLAGWFVDPDRNGLGSLVNRGGGSSWWQSAMPWPQGVQEEDGVGWHIRDPDPSIVGSIGGDPTAHEPRADAFEVAPVQPRSRIRFHHPAPKDESPR
jgi:hypothetical protein